MIQLHVIYCMLEWNKNNMYGKTHKTCSAILHPHLSSSLTSSANSTRMDKMFDCIYINISGRFCTAIGFVGARFASNYVNQAKIRIMIIFLKHCIFYYCVVFFQLKYIITRL